jgi:hypothetical protein
MTQLDSQLARLLVDDYLDGLADRSLDDIRAMRADCEQAETSVSFLRRLAQGRLDIIHAYLDRREAQGAGALEDLVDELSDIMAAGPPRPGGPGRLPSAMAPDMEGGGLASELSAFEARVSQQRRALHDRIDRLQGEIVSRYKTGGASVDELLA